jgi:hypothetical protein
MRRFIMSQLQSDRRFRSSGYRAAVKFAAALIAAILLVLSGSRVSRAAPGSVTIINLRSSALFVAYATEREEDVGDLAVMPQTGYRYAGWYRIDPGRSRDFPANAWIYVEHNRNRISWPNQTEGAGVIHPTDSFDQTITGYANQTSDYNWRNAAERLQARGYNIVTFQRMAAGGYTVTGDGFALRTQNFSFDFGSRDPQTHNQCFDVPGTVVNYSRNVERYNQPSDLWSINGGRLCVTVVTQGYRPYPTAPRERGYYRGSVTVSYTTPIAGASGGSSGGSGGGWGSLSGAALSSLSLAAGFTPDPNRQSVTAGGSTLASSLQSGCSGSIGAQPNVELNWSGTSSQLRVFMVASIDTVLLIRDPNGRYHCSDDWRSGDLNPMVTFTNPAPGAYRIWAGTFAGGTISSTLYITELERNPASPN